MSEKMTVQWLLLDGLDTSLLQALPAKIFAHPTTLLKSHHDDTFSCNRSEFALDHLLSGHACPSPRYLVRQFAAQIKDETWDTLHLFGLLSDFAADGSIHETLSMLSALLKTRTKKIHLHLILGSRNSSDMPLDHLNELQDWLHDHDLAHRIHIASLCGSHFALSSPAQYVSMLTQNVPSQPFSNARAHLQLFLNRNFAAENIPLLRHQNAAPLSGGCTAFMSFIHPKLFEFLEALTGPGLCRTATLQFRRHKKLSEISSQKTLNLVDPSNSIKLSDSIDVSKPKTSADLTILYNDSLLQSLRSGIQSRIQSALEKLLTELEPMIHESSSSRSRCHTILQGVSMTPFLSHLWTRHTHPPLIPLWWWPNPPTAFRPHADPSDVLPMILQTLGISHLDDVPGQSLTPHL